MFLKKDKSISWKQATCIVIILHVAVIIGIKQYSSYRKEMAKNLKEAREKLYNKPKSEWWPQPKTRVVSYPNVPKVLHNSEPEKKEILVSDVINEMFIFLEKQIKTFNTFEFNNLTSPKKETTHTKKREIPPKRTAKLKPSPTPIPVKRAIAIVKPSPTPIPVKRAIAVTPSYYPTYPPIPRMVDPSFEEVYYQQEIQREVDNIVNDVSFFNLF